MGSVSPEPSTTTLIPSLSQSHASLTDSPEPYRLSLIRVNMSLNLQSIVPDSREHVTEPPP